MSGQRRRLRAFELLCLGTTALTCFGTVAPANAQSEAGIARQQAGSAFKTARDFNIGAGSLNDALHKWASISKLKIFAPSGVLNGKTTLGATGTMTAEAALKQLLAGTSLSFGIAGENTISVFSPSASRDVFAQAIELDTINVEGAGERVDVTGPVRGFVATQTATGTKTSTPIVEVPQSISVVPLDQVTAQGSQSLTQALRYTPGVLAETVGVGSFNSSFMRARGFVADLYLDGMRLPNPPSASSYPELEPYNLERIEVLKGPSSGLYGSGAPGGLVNVTSKRPLDTPFHEVALQTGSYNRKQAQFDVSDRINGSPDALFRVVGLIRDSDHQIDYFEDNRKFIAPSLTVKNDSTKLTLLASYFYSDQRFSFFNYMPASGTVLPNPNGRIGMHTYYGEPSYDRLKREQFTIGYAFEHRFNDALQFRQNLRYFTNNTDMWTIAPGRQGSNPTLNNDPRTGLLVGDPTMANVRRGAIYNASDNRAFTVDNQLEGRFNTGPLAHTVLLGLDYRTLSSTYDYIAGGTRTTLNVFAPTYGATIQQPNQPLQGDVYRLEQTGVYVQDQIKYDGWIVTLVGRHDWATSLQDDRLFDTKGFFGAQDTAFTGRAGLGYDFRNGFVPYVSYATSFDPVIGSTASGQSFKPTTGEQYEAGVKYQPPGTNTLVTAAAFDITQQNVLTSDPFNAGRSIQTGEVSVRGFEVEVRTELLPRLNVIAGYTYLDAQITKSNVAGEVGQQPQFTPEHQASLWAQYGLSGPYLAGLTVGAGVRYVGSTSAFIPGANYGGTVGVVAPFVLNTPAYTLVDAMASYDLAHLSPSLKGANLRVSAINLFDTYYIAGCSSTIQCGLGTARTVLATLSYKW